MRGIRIFIEHAGGVFISQCDHWLIHLLFFAPAKNNASESLHLRQRITVILIQKNDGYFMPKIEISRTFGSKKTENLLIMPF